MHLKIVTHEKVVYDDNVDEIYSKGIDGEFGVLKNHIPFMTALDVGVTKVVKDGVETEVEKPVKFIKLTEAGYEFDPDQSTEENK